MSLIDYAGAGVLRDMFVPCHMMDRISANPNGTFDTQYRYQQGAAFYAMLRKDSDPAIRAAEAQAGKGMYTVVVKQGVSLKHGDVIRRDSDGLTLAVTGRTLDWKAPDMSTLKLAKTTAEEWEIPS